MHISRTTTEKPFPRAISVGNYLGDSAAVFLLQDRGNVPAGYGAVSPNMNKQYTETTPIMHPQPWGGQQAPGPSVHSPPYYNPSAPLAAAAGQPAGLGGEPPVSRADMDSLFAEEDLFRMTPHVKVEYAEVFNEAAGANSIECCGDVTGLIFKWTQLGVYRFFSLTLGVILVLLWGIAFAIFNFISVFFAQPLVKVLFIILRPCVMLYTVLVRSITDPLWQSMGLIYSRVKGRFAFNINGLTSQTPTRHDAIQEV